MGTPSLARRMFPLALTSFLSSFSSSGFKVWVVLSVLGSSFDYFRDSSFLLSMAAVCVLPSVFMPMFSGFIADRFPKRYMYFCRKECGGKILCPFVLQKVQETG